jgi:hypothetical protein
MQNGGIAKLVEALRNYVEQRGHYDDAKKWAEEILAKVKEGAS